MRKFAGFSILAILTMFLAALPAGAQECPTSAAIFLGLIPCAQVQYHGGPILENYTIYPLYYGNWTQEEIETQQTFLTNLAAYISGANAPAKQQPTLWQYGPRSVTVAAPVWVNQTTSPDQYTSTCNGSGQNSPGNLYDCDAQIIIGANQGSGPNQVPEFGPERVIFLFPAPNFGNPECNCGGYHASLSDASFYGVVYNSPPGGYGLAYSDAESQYQAVTSHEVFEDATDPAVDNFFGWVTVSCSVYVAPTNPPTPCPATPTPAQIKTGNLNKEVADQCATVVTLNWPNQVTLQFAAIVDNTLNGACTTTGYMPQDEIALYELSPAEFETENQIQLYYDYQLYVLQSYVLSNGDRHYNAVWRPQAPGTAKQGGPAKGLYYANQMVDAGYAPPYQPRFDSLQSMGWSLYTFHTAIHNSSPLYYDAVWRQGTSVVDTAENGLFGATEKAFRSKYEAEFPTPNDWRLYGLQGTSTDWIDAVWHRPDGPSYQNVDNVPPTPCNCSDELHIYGGTFAEYMTDYNNFYPQGFRLYILDPYVTADGTVLYNAIWRSTRTYDEVPIYGYTLKDYKTEYENELSNGFYLYILSAYVLPGDEVRYDAVFRRGMFDRPL
jgi:Bacterial tandem repeat domain 1